MKKAKNRTKREKVYIFDLDHTLLNTKKFKGDLGILIENNPNSISEKLWSSFKKKEKKTINFIENKTKEYLFENVCSNLKKTKAKKILLTYGNLEFQKLKIDALNLEKKFQKIIITDKNKIIFLREFSEKNKDKEIIFINDTYNKRFSENKEISRKIPEITIFEVDNYKPQRKKTISDIFKKIL